MKRPSLVYTLNCEHPNPQSIQVKRYSTDLLPRDESMALEGSYASNQKNLELTKFGHSEHRMIQYQVPHSASTDGSNNPHHVSSEQLKPQLRQHRASSWFRRCD